jgi:hypothetical protein
MDYASTGLAEDMGAALPLHPDGIVILLEESTQIQWVNSGGAQ